MGLDWNSRVRALVSKEESDRFFSCYPLFGRFGEVTEWLVVDTRTGKVIRNGLYGNEASKICEELNG